MDVGPTQDGRIIPMFEERLRQLGSWLDVNGEAIYINKTLTFRTHHYCLTNHITIETDHKEFPPYIIAPYNIILILEHTANP
jgi:alpha-L-fucosidase